MIGISMALALAQPPMFSDLKGGSVVMPPEISAAVAPYLQCTVMRSNTDPRMPSGDRELLLTIHRDSLAACAPLRRSAFERSDRILKDDRRYRDEAERHALIERVLGDAENSFVKLLDALPTPNGRPKSGN